MDERQERDSCAFEGLTATMTPEQEVATRRQSTLYREVLKEAVSTLRLHFADGLTGDQIGEQLNISRATVVRWLSTARAFLLRETRRLLTDRLRLSVAEADSLIATAHSRLDLSLSVLLASETR